MSVVKPSEVIAEPAAVLALAETLCPSLNGASSYRLASALEAIDFGLDLGEFPELQGVVRALAELSESRVDHWRCYLESSDVRLVTVLDDDYPANLRMVHDHPPFLFVRGSLLPSDERAVAVVGTRTPGTEGVCAARRVAVALSSRKITVVSGMAMGVDAAAHTGALDSGGRTLAVFGTGIDRIYPRSNRELASRIVTSGATVSQFWPDMRPTRWSFPVRNIVTSGLSMATVVVEAGPTSGARQQAEHAIRHGKRLFLLRRLVEDQAWAREMIKADGVLAIDDIDEIVAAVEMELDLDADVLV